MQGVVLEKVTKDKYFIDDMGKKETYQLKWEFPFNSNRKRQSVILIDDHENIILMTKGAD